MKLSQDKIMHSYAVAEYMYDNAPRYNLDPEDMYLLGLVHDIGYLNDSRNHGKYGEGILYRNRFPFASTVAWHGASPSQYLEFTRRESVPAPLILLWEADLTINHKGENVGFDERLKDIANRYGVETEQYTIANETVAWLKERMGD